MKGSRRLLVVLLLASPSFAFAGPAERAERCVAASDKGQEQRDKGALLEARTSLRACAADDCPALVRKDCARWLEEVEQNVPTVVLAAKDAQGGDLAGVTALVDGVPHQEELRSGRAFGLDPGPHVFTFEHPPNAPAQVNATLRMGERNRQIVATFAAPASPPAAQAPVVAVPAPAPAPAPIPVLAPETRTLISPWAWVFGGVGVAGLGSFTYFGISGLNEKATLRSSCGSACTDAQVSPLKTRYIIADVSLGIGVIAALGSAWLFLHPTREAKTPSTTVSITPLPGGASLGAVGTF